MMPPESAPRGCNCPTMAGRRRRSTGRLEDSSMSLTRCPFCEHGNPADSKFCSECGGALHLAPCPRCGAVSQVTATVCYQCGGPLPGRGTDAPVPSAPAAGVSRSLPRRLSRVIVGTAFLAAIAVLGYTAYRQRSPVDATQPRAASSDASGPGPVASPAGSSLAAPVRAAANAPRAGRQPVKSQEAKAAAITRPRAADAGRAGGQGLPRPPACTEAVAALGLCATKPEAGKEGGREPSRAPGCTAAAAALGLCAAGTTQRRE
jgi:double zinc ribbon protein